MIPENIIANSLKAAGISELPIFSESGERSELDFARIIPYPEDRNSCSRYFVNENYDKTIPESEKPWLDKTWWQFCNWGCFSNAFGTYRGDNCIRFCTFTEPPMRVFAELSGMYPEKEFTLQCSFDEEHSTDFTVFHAKNGIIYKSETYCIAEEDDEYAERLSLPENAERSDGTVLIGKGQIDGENKDTWVELELVSPGEGLWRKKVKSYDDAFTHLLWNGRV